MVEVADVDVQIVRLQVAVLRRQRVEAVVRQGDGLGVLEFREDAGREDELVVGCVTLAGTQRLLRRGGPRNLSATFS